MIWPISLQPVLLSWTKKWFLKKMLDVNFEVHLWLNLTYFKRKVLPVYPSLVNRCLKKLKHLNREYKWIMRPWEYPPPYWNCISISWITAKSNDKTGFKKIVTISHRVSLNSCQHGCIFAPMLSTKIVKVL